MVMGSCGLDWFSSLFLLFREEYCIAIACMSEHPRLFQMFLSLSCDCYVFCWGLSHVAGTFAELRECDCRWLRKCTSSATCYLTMDQDVPSARWTEITYGMTLLITVLSHLHSLTQYRYIRFSFLISRLSILASHLMSTTHRMQSPEAIVRKPSSTCSSVLRCVMNSSIFSLPSW